MCVCVKYKRKIRQRKNKDRNFSPQWHSIAFRIVKTTLWFTRLRTSWPQFTALATWPTPHSSYARPSGSLNMPVLLPTSGSSAGVSLPVVLLLSHLRLASLPQSNFSGQPPPNLQSALLLHSCSWASPRRGLTNCILVVCFLGQPSHLPTSSWGPGSLFPMTF